MSLPAITISKPLISSHVYTTSNQSRRQRGHDLQEGTQYTTYLVIVELTVLQFDNCVCLIFPIPVQQDHLYTSVHSLRLLQELGFEKETQLTIQAADLLVNAGLGFGVGVVASVLLFRRELASISSFGSRS